MPRLLALIKFETVLASTHGYRCLIQKLLLPICSTRNFNMLKRALSRYKRALQLIPSTVICQLGIQVNRFILIPHLPRLVSQKFLPNLVTRAWQITLSTLLKLYLVRHSTLRKIQIELQKHVVSISHWWTYSTKTEEVWRQLCSSSLNACSSRLLFLCGVPLSSTF